MKRNYILPSTAILALALAAWFGHTRAAHSQQGQPNGTPTAAPAATNSPTAPATPQPISQGKRSFHYPSLYDKLDLTKDQQEKLSAVFQEAYGQSKAINEDKSLPMPQKLAKMTAIVKERREKINAVLTTEQQQKYLKVRREMEAQHAPESRLKMLTLKLQLTEAQQAKIKPILEEEVRQTEALRGEKMVLSREEAEKLRQVHETAVSQIKAAVTPEQAQKLEAMIESSKVHGRAPVPTAVNTITGVAGPAQY